MPFKTDIKLHNIKALSPYRTVNISSPLYTSQPDAQRWSVCIVTMINILGRRNEEFYYSDSWCIELP
jgi:hypothetical protein